MVYTDSAGNLIADTSDELHTFAARLGLRRSWFQNHPKHPHYDLTTERMRKKAVKFGALLVDRRKIVEIIKQNLKEEKYLWD